VDEFAAMNLLHCFRHHVRQSLDFLFFKNVLIGTSHTLPIATIPFPPVKVLLVTVDCDMCGLGKILVNWDETLKTGFFVAWCSKLWGQIAPIMLIS
jgi:hypothetical protein